MKSLIPVLMLLSLFIAACGEDNNPTTPPPSNETLIYSRDSLSIFTLDSGNIVLFQSSQFISSDLKQVRIEFTGETNIDSSSGEFLAQYNVQDTVNNQFITSMLFSGITAFNKNHNNTVTHSITSTLQFNFGVDIFSSTNHSLKYLRMKNIKIYKVTS